MLSSTFLSPSIRLTLPTARRQAAASDQQSLIISIDQAGALFLNNDSLSWEQLETRLRALLDKSEHKVVLVRCDEASPHRYFVRALNAAKAAGAAHVQVAYQPEPRGDAAGREP
jgi:biopolymer transport protein ExbD